MVDFKQIEWIEWSSAPHSHTVNPDTWGETVQGLFDTRQQASSITKKTN